MGRLSQSQKRAAVRQTRRTAHRFRQRRGQVLSARARVFPNEPVSGKHILELVESLSVNLPEATVKSVLSENSFWEGVRRYCYSWIDGLGLSTTLGLDLGKNSIGWALIRDGETIRNDVKNVFDREIQYVKAPEQATLEAA